MLMLLLVPAVSLASDPAPVPLTPEQRAEQEHEELIGELSAMAEDVRTIDVELLKKAIEAHQQEQAALVSMETAEISDDSGELLLAPVPVMGPAVAP